MERERSDGGFTLIELLVVIIIIGILAAIAVPVLLKQRQKGYDAQAKADLHQVALLEESYLAEFGGYSTKVVVASTAPADTIPYVKSQRTSLIAVEYIGPTGTLAGATPATGFCLSTTSDSGRVFSYLSTVGLLVVGTGCP